MELLGLNVAHTKFGFGKIVKEEKRLFDVEFENGEIKHFIYPDSLSSGILKFEDKELTNQALALYKERERKERLVHVRRVLDRNREDKKKEKEALEAQIKAERKYRKRLYKIAYHEAGHAVVSEVLNPNSVLQINFLRGKSTQNYVNGVTTHKPINSGVNKEYIEKNVMIALAGVAAEEIAFGKKVQRKNGSDMKEVNEGILYLKLFFSVKGEKEEIKKHYINEVKKLLKQNRRLLDKIANGLVEKQYLSAKDIQNLKAA